MTRTVRNLSLLAVTICCGAAGLAQSYCPTSILLGTSAKRSGNLTCLVPQVYGPGGLVGNDNGGPLNATTGHEVHFQASSLSSLGPVNAEIGVALSQLPIAAPVAGFVFEAGGVQATENFGPVLTDRADTIGKNRIFVGTSYQYFNFDKVDGVNLHNFGAVFTHEAEPDVCAGGGVPCLNGEPIYTRDIIATTNRIDLKVHQLTFVATFGIRDGLDISVALPTLDVRVNAQSFATIFCFEPPPVDHTFAPSTGNPEETYINPFTASFQNGSSATGIGDVTFRGKLRAWQDAEEKSAVAVGLDVRLPTGDAYNFGGAGTWGIRPFVTYSRSGRLSPHATLGLQTNGQSPLAGDVTSVPVTKSKLPDVFTYTSGVEFSIRRNLSVSSDFIGQTLLNAPQIAQTTYIDYDNGQHANIATSTGTVNQMSIAVGGKFAILDRLLVSANGLFRVNDAGLHAKPVPLLGLSYTF